MLSLKEWLELVDYRITEGDAYAWDCYGPNAYTLSSWNGIHGKGGWSFDIVFSKKTQKVYEITIADYTNNRAYRMIAKNKREKHRKAAENVGVRLNEAWDDVEYVDLEVDDDFIQKALAVRNGDDYDTRVQMELDLPEADLLFYMKEAHKRDMTFNKCIEEALKSALEEFERDPEGMKARAEVMFGSPNGA